MWRVVFGCVLVASVATNVLLLRQRARADAKGTSSPLVPPASKQRAPLATTRVSVPPSVVALDDEKLEQRIASAEERLYKLLPLHERFDLEPPAPDHEARLKPLWDRVLRGAPYTLECRGRVCKVETKASNDWQTSMGMDPDNMGYFDGQSIGSNGIYVQVNDEAKVAGIQWFMRLYIAMHASSAVDACKKEHPTAGSVIFKLALDAQHQLDIATTGTLANQAGGVCIRKVLESLVAAKPLPAEVTELPNDAFGIRVP
ncbi:MAG: hypothetical protein H0T46_10955 [Deltaproteobacteria bacterium]|nr:hypothetical protein [Deltaproteobacteria bacterium]